MTPVIITGGIDLSVGALMGLSAVLFGMMWDPNHANLPMYVAIPGTLAVGFVAGCMNALLITKLRLPPLIVTLGTFSLFRGLGEGLTGGTASFNAPESFQFLGQGYLPGGIPAQLPIFVAAAIWFWLLLQRTTIGRGLYAIGFSVEGSRHAGIPVERRLNLVYILSGTIASLAAIIFVSKVGQAKSDAGLGYELTAITAVVLGGTSIFGGRGTIQGTVLGLFAIKILQNGLQLAALPGYLTEILMGCLLLVTISMERLGIRGVFGGRSARTTSEEFEVKNSQVFALSIVILLAAAIVAGSNWLLLRDLHTSGGDSGKPSSSSSSKNTEPASNEKPDESAKATAMFMQQMLSLMAEQQANAGKAPTQVIAKSDPGTDSSASAAKSNTRTIVARSNSKKIRIGMMPKSLGNAYFIACRKGAEQAASELGVELDWQGPTDPDPAKQSANCRYLGN